MEKHKIVNTQEIRQAEMALKVSENLIPAIEHTRKTDTVWVFNRKEKTVCITCDLAYAARVSLREQIPLEVAATALPIALAIN